MSTTTTTMPFDIPSPVAVRLRGLRRKIAAWLLVDGFSRFLFWVIVLIGVDLGIDWLFRMDRPQRGVVLVMMAAALVLIAYRRLVRPLSLSPADDALCLKVEDQHKQLGQSLISAVQFSRIGDVRSLGVSPVLVRATIDHGVRSATAVDFGGALNRARFRGNLAMLCLLAAGLIGIGVGVAYTNTMSTWFYRNILLADRPWPRDTYLIVRGVDKGRVVIPRGDDWPLIVDVSEDSRHLPDRVYVDFRPAYGRPSEVIERVQDKRRFTTEFKNVVEPFRFRVRSRRSRTSWMTVDLVDRPSVEELRLHVTAPDYAGGEKEELPSGRGPYYVLPGSHLDIQGTANKPLSSATLTAAGRTHRLTISDETRFSGHVAAEDLVAGPYDISLVDTESPTPLISRRPTRFTIKVKPDRAPRIRAKLIGISGMVVPGASIPIDLRITDDFAVTAAALRYRWRTETSDAEGNTGVLPLEVEKDELGKSSLSMEVVFELGPLKIPADAGLNFHVEANDNDAISGPKTGKSTEFLLRVVSEDRLRADLLRREKEQRQELEQILKNQEDVMTQCEVLLATVRGKEGFPVEQRQVLAKAQKRQKLLGTNLEAVAMRLRSILIEVQNNHLEEEDGPIQRRLQNQIIGPMLDLAGDAMPSAAVQLDQARRLARETAQRDEALDTAIVQQREIVEELRVVLRHMVKSESYQEAVNLLYEIVKSQQDLRKMTAEEARERVRQILEGGGETPKKDKKEDGDKDVDNNNKNPTTQEPEK